MPSAGAPAGSTRVALAMTSPRPAAPRTLALAHGRSFPPSPGPPSARVMGGETLRTKAQPSRLRTAAPPGCRASGLQSLWAAEPLGCRASGLQSLWAAEQSDRPLGRPGLAGQPWSLEGSRLSPEAPPQGDRQAGGASSSGPVGYPPSPRLERGGSIPTRESFKHSLTRTLAGSPCPTWSSRPRSTPSRSSAHPSGSRSRRRQQQPTERGHLISFAVRYLERV